MNQSNIVKILMSATSIANNAKKNIFELCQNIFEEKFLQEKYVTREEFDNLKLVLLDMQSKYSDNSKK